MLMSYDFGREGAPQRRNAKLMGYTIQTRTGGASSLEGSSEFALIFISRTLSEAKKG